MDNGVGIGDLLAVMNSRDDNNGWGGSWMWVIFLFFIFAIFFAGDGFFGRRNNDTVSKADLCEAMNFNQLENATRGLSNGLCDGFYAQNTTALQGLNALQSQACQGFNGVNGNITELGYQAKDCCCEINRNIDAVRYENARNTCDIIAAGQANTQRIIDHMTQDTIQSLRDQLQTANFQLSQQAQSANLINQLRPCPIPAYLSCSPYQTQSLSSQIASALNNYGYGYGYGGCGCGCNN